MPGLLSNRSADAAAAIVRAGLIETEDLIIDAKSGATGAGRSLKEQNLFSEVAEAMHAYGVGAHRRT